MGHDSQVPQEQPETSTDLSSQRKTSQDVVLFWLGLYAALPYMREKAKAEQWDWERIILFYSSSLAKLSHPTALHKAFEHHRDKTLWLAQVPEILEQYEIELGKMRAQESQQREAIELCGDCRGTGWKKVPRPDGHGEWVVSCDCRKRKTA